MPANAYKYFGNLIHRFTYLFYKKNWKSREKFLKAWKFYWYNQVMPDGKFYQPGQVKFRCKGEPYIFARTGIDILNRFWDDNYGRPKPFHVEKSFSKEINGWSFNGRWDRIEKTEEDYSIIDYKSDKELPGPNDYLLRRNIQFTIYSLVFREVFGIKENKIEFYHLPTGKRVPTFRTEEDYQYLFQKLMEAEKDIRKKKFSSFVGFHCRWCDFEDYCQENNPDFDKKETPIEIAPLI